MSILKQILIFNKRIFLLHFLFILIRVCPALAQQVTFTHVTLPEISNFGLINAVTQDPSGYMWFASYDRGLLRSDGYHVITYSNDPLNPGSLISNRMEVVYADHEGMIWTGTGESGLDRLDPGTGHFTHFRYNNNDPASLSDDRISSILETHDGSIWVGTRNGLNRLNPKTKVFTRYQYNAMDSTTLSNNNV